MALTRNWKRWLHGAIAALFGGGTSPVSAMALKPDAFNLGGQLRDFLALWFISGLVAVLVYFKTAPPPIYADEEIAPRDWKDKE